MSKGNTSLHRPVEGRWLAGVAAGLALRFDLPVWLIRAIFILLCFVAGLGFFLYVAGWLLIPSEGEADAILAGWLGDGAARRWVAVILIGLAVIFIAGETRFIRSDLVFAVVLVGIGVMLYRGDLSRRDSRPDDASPPSQDDPPAPAGAVSTDGEAPDRKSTPPPAREKSFLGRVTVGCAVLALGILGLFDSILPGFSPQVHHYMALLVVIVGLGLVVGAWFGRSGGLIALGVILIPLLILSPLATLVDLGSDPRSRGRFVYEPAYVGQILDGYEVGMGSLVIDLSHIDFAGQTVRTEVDLGMGEVTVYLPEGVAAVVSGDVGMGELHVGHRRTGGIGIDEVYYLEGSEGRLVLEADVRIGQVKVRNIAGP